MPAHSSNYCQPLDVPCFAPLKKAYGDLVQKLMRHGFNHIDKLDFLEAYPDARKCAFAPNTIKNGFRASGLVPFNPEEVLQRFTIQLKTPTPPGSRATNSTLKTPHNSQQLDKQASILKGMLRQNTPPSLEALEMRMDKIVKGHQIALHESIIARQEFQEMKVSHEKKIQKRTRSRKQIATEEGLSIGEGQSIIEDRNQPAEAITAPSIDPVPAVEYRSTRAPPRCSDCNIQGHRRTRCPNRNRN